MKPPICDPSAASGEQSRDQLRQRFIEACASRGDGPPPDPEAFVAAFPEPERSSLRSELELLQRAHIQPTTSDAVAETRKNAIDMTVDQVPAPVGTIDHLPAPQGTVDHVPMRQEAIAPISRKPRISDIPVPQSVAGYEVIEVLGRGAMGVVYKARQRGLTRLVALKMILSGAHASAQDLARFRAEANAVGALKHPGIVQIYEVGEDEGRPFFSLEFIDGPSLHKKIQGTPLPPRQAAALLQKMAEAMAYAHEHNIIHRDLKPANVLLTQDGEPKIGDFGLAKHIEQHEDAGLTRTGTVLGTPSYMSPEQAEGRVGEVGPLADVYSLGAILYDMLTGRPPFRGTSVLDTLEQLRTQEPVPPMYFQPGVPRDLETICLKCLHKDRTKRYASARELAADVGRFLRGEPIKARPVSMFERAARWCRRNKMKTAVIAAFALGIIGYAATTTWLLQRESAARSIADEKTQLALASVEDQRQTATQSLEGMASVSGNMIHLLHSKPVALAANKEVLKLRDNVVANLEKSLITANKRIQAVGKNTFADVAAAQVTGDLMMKLGRTDRARELYRSGHASVSERVAREPNNDRARGNLGIMEMRLGDVALKGDGDARTALKHYLAARQLDEEIQRAPRGNEYKPLEAKRHVGHDDVRVGEALLVLGQPEQARSYFEEALAYRQEWSDAEPHSLEARSYIVEVRVWLGTTAWHLGDAAAVDHHFGEALAINTQLIKDAQPDYVPYREDLADLQGAYGDALVRLGRPADALKHYRESHATLEWVVKRKPDDDMSYHPQRALAHERLGSAHDLLKQPAEAMKHRVLARHLRMELWLAEKDSRSRQAAFILAQARSGDCVTAKNNANSKRPGMVGSPVLMLQIARCFAICSADARLDRKETVALALAALEGAIGDDYRDARALETDPDLAPLRGEPGFRKLIARIAARSGT